ncbi:DUF1783-domain-containing protein, partial [Clavulina sp. PMI_390]
MRTASQRHWLSQLRSHHLVLSRRFVGGSLPRPSSPRELPHVKRSYLSILAASALVIGSWSSFLLFATNEERLSSSVVRRVLAAVTSDPDANKLLGESITLEPSWIYLGSPNIAGQINLLQGSVDIKFRLQGSDASGTVYFSSIRRAKGEHFEILRFKIIADNGKIVDLSKYATSNYEEETK